jgi:hypothetical protein
MNVHNINKDIAEKVLILSQRRSETGAIRDNFYLFLPYKHTRKDNKKRLGHPK